MSQPSFLDHIAYQQIKGTTPGVIFLHGYRSDMEGTKAIALQDWQAEWGNQYTRFDVSGHGLSQIDQPFHELHLSHWLDDAARVLNELTTGPQILVGSSMGGWLSLLLAQNFPDRIKHIVGVAAAPDFTKRIPQRSQIVEGGYKFSDDSFATHDFINDGNEHALLHKKLDLQCNVTLLQGKEDDVVPWTLAEEIKGILQPNQCEIIYIDDGDHRLNRPEDLAILKRSVESVLR